MPSFYRQIFLGGLPPPDHPRRSRGRGHSAARPSLERLPQRNPGFPGLRGPGPDGGRRTLRYQDEAGPTAQGLFPGLSI